MKRTLDSNIPQMPSRIKRRTPKNSLDLENRDGTSEEVLTSPRKCKKPNSLHTRKLIEWTPQEDLILQGAVQKSETLNWKKISKLFNKENKEIKRNSHECKARWKIINTTKTWNINEELVLLLTFYKNGNLPCQIQGMFENEIEAKKHLKTLLDQAVLKIKNSDYEIQGPFEQIKLLIEIKLLLDAFFINEPIKEIIEILQENKLEKVHCLAFLNYIGNQINSKKCWDYQSLINFLDSTLEKIINKFIATDTSDEEIDSLMHQRQPPPIENMPQIVLPLNPHMQYCLVPISYAGQGYYVMALCYVQPGQNEGRPQI